MAAKKTKKAVVEEVQQAPVTPIEPAPAGPIGMKVRVTGPDGKVLFRGSEVAWAIFHRTHLLPAGTHVEAIQKDRAFSDLNVRKST